MAQKKEIGYKRSADLSADKKTVLISQTLVVKPPARQQHDIGEWRDALKSADRGRRKKLYDLFDDLLIDGVLYEAMDKRIRAITNSDIIFTKNEKEVDEMADFMDTLEFEELVREIMLTKFYGKSVIEFDFKDGFKAVSIKRQHINTESKQILKNTSDQDGIPYTDNDFLLNLGKDSQDYGIFLRTAPFTIFKRNGLGDYTQFCELFGIPDIIGLYDPDDETGRIDMENALKNRGGSGSMVMSKNSDIKPVGGEVAGSANVHEKFINLLDQQILISVQGQTMTTTSGQSYAQAKVHGETEDDINAADRRYVRRVLNSLLIPILEKRGYPVKGGWFHFAEKGASLQPKDQLDIALRIHKEVKPVDEAWFFDTFGVPMEQNPGEASEVSERSRGQRSENNLPDETAEDIPDENDNNRKSKKVKPKKLSLYQQVKDFFQGAPR